jgi:hypothetical protein
LEEVRERFITTPAAVLLAGARAKAVWDSDTPSLHDLLLELMPSYENEIVGTYESTLKGSSTLHERRCLLGSK